MNIASIWMLIFELNTKVLDNTMGLENTMVLDNTVALDNTVVLDNTMVLENTVQILYQTATRPTSDPENKLHSDEHC